MARARNIKPGFYKNEDLAECSVWARYIFPGLWMLADREGRLEDRPKRIKGELLPFDSQDVEPLLAELAARGFLVRYRNSDGAFIQISKFTAHQSPHYSEKPSAIKPPEFLEPSKKDAVINGGAQPPDSLIPDSLIPEKSIVGQVPDVAPRSELKGKAKELLGFLNAKTGRNFEPVAVNLERIEARLKEGASFDDCKSIIAKKCGEWSTDEKMAQYLRPATLFGREKFWQYHGQLEAM